MRIVVYADYPELFTSLQQEAERYSELDLTQVSSQVAVANLPEFDFLLLAPLGRFNDVGAPCIPSAQLDLWQKKMPALGDLCLSKPALVFLLSSDRVFASSQQAVSELDMPSNSEDVALQLLDLEKQVAALHESIILRTPPSLNAAAGGGLGLLLQASQAGQEFTQEYRGLQTLDDLARVILGVMLQVDAGAQARGVYHYAGLGPISQADLAAKINPDLAALAVKTPSAVAAKQLSGFSSQHLLNTFGVHPRSWQEKLPNLLEELYATQ